MAADTTGGWRWHWRAFRRRRRWRETAAQLAAWLDGTRPASDELLLVGGSAGWMMSGRWLQRFARVTVVDLDPLAPRLFGMNHGRALAASGTRLEFLRMDALANLPQLLASHPSASVFFDNVLGQHRYRVPQVERAEAELNGLAARLAGRDWGSVHDLFSGPVRPDAGCASLRLDGRVGSQGVEIDGQKGDALHRRILANAGASGAWMDHLTSGVLPPGTDSALISWPFLPGYSHWLQAGWVAPR